MIKKLGKDITWIRTGGEVDIFEPNSIYELKSFLKNNKKVIPVGFGSNIIIPDSGLDKTIIRLNNMQNDIQINSDHLTINAGTPNIIVSRFCTENNLSNLEFLHTIPGTIGGALYMNAGAYGYCVSDYLLWAELIDLDGNIHRLNRCEIKYEYRKSNIPDGMIFLKGCFKVENCNNVKNKIKQMKQYRNDKQPRVNTFGSVFTNHAKYNAWKLIEQSGCYGMKIGGAYISELHCNFIINDGSATSKNIKDLINQIQQKVFNHSGILLEEEVIFL
ncbi:UDP-N-acetylmuramate dehydrogenase [Candidatus Cytomitobacter indipagum]|uniref:UDP-N-acetylenolpyruvoylglucosamine reductase n=1 Tax=Candidatus Cytomitobacter indipagum TaxID=2601575 RepID=A0A5C0UEU6_9PROT|nr:UDP-N-acetylmuramate dehydrogenase [Candidatus Cytomitobacter indipagum]QEK38163.1 UDP-N-acetylmuramate dehydrogenase [Candidatus Cytomitobacter indipagum]